jgi:transcriptional regulator with XRE-family HTH domain
MRSDPTRGSGRAKKPKRRPAGDTGANRGITVAVGAQIRDLRNKLGLTGAAVASRSGLSVGMLSKIENGNVMASLESLAALAQALNVPVTTLFASFDQARPCRHVPAGTGFTDKRLSEFGSRLLGHWFTNGLVCELHLVTVSAKSRSALVQQTGTEFIYVLNGCMLYRHADKTYRLAPGDVLLFDSAALHGPEELIESPVSYLSWRNTGPRSLATTMNSSRLAMDAF